MSPVIEDRIYDITSILFEDSLYVLKYSYGIVSGKRDDLSFRLVCAFMHVTR
jgi:hypothetical protein